MSPLHLFVSPHFDDAIGACGGIMAQRAQRGERVTLLTVFGGAPPGDPSDHARGLHRTAGLPDAEAVAMREAENWTAAARLGVTAASAPLPEAIYRQGKAGQWRYPTGPTLFGTGHSEDAALVGAIERVVADIADVAGGTTLIHLPMGIGRHIDHRLVALAGRRLAAGGRRVVHYEDFWWRERAPPPRPQGLERRAVALSPADIDAKVAAFAAYRSQIIGLYGTAAAMAAQMRQVAIRDGAGTPAEPLWTPAAPLVDGPLAP